MHIIYELKDRKGAVREEIFQFEYLEYGLLDF